MISGSGQREREQDDRQRNAVVQSAFYVQRSPNWLRYARARYHCLAQGRICRRKDRSQYRALPESQHVKHHRGYNRFKQNRERQSDRE